jgi:hypothetical protein
VIDGVTSTATCPYVVTDDEGTSHCRLAADPRARDALWWALGHFVGTDEANATIHCAPVKYSPITFRIAEALASLGVDHVLVEKVITHRGQYEEDRGR